MMKLVPPRRRLPGSFVMKPRCANDVPVKLRVPPPQVSPTSVCVMNASWRFVYSAPLGAPVVPDVKMIATGRSGSSGSAGGALAVPRSSASSGCVRVGRAVDDLDVGGASGSTPGAAIDEARRGALEHRVALAARESRSFTPAVIAPSFAAARYARRYSGPGGRTSATTSPAPTPRAASPTATSSESRSRSAYEIGQPSAR